MNNFFWNYLLKFIFVFCGLYFGTQLIIGLTVPGNYYSAFVYQYLDYVSTLRKSLLLGAHYLIYIFGYKSLVQNNYFLTIENGSQVRMVYSCLGIGVFSFWAGFVIANDGKLLSKIKWILIGFISIWLINVGRISLLLLSHNNKWSSPKWVNHHTIFNIVAYVAVFLLMYVFHHSQKKVEQNISE